MSQLRLDGYKLDHRRQYYNGTSYVCSNWTGRKSRIPGVDYAVFFGLQYYLKEYAIKQWQNDFFTRPVGQVIKEYARRLNHYTPGHTISFEHIEQLHAHGKLPIDIRALPEGTKVPIGVPMFIMMNTNPEFFWVTNYLETQISNIIWMPCVSATIAYNFRQMLNRYAKMTSEDMMGFIGWQGHDFSYRGMAGLEAAMMSGAGHLLSFVGTDTIPAIEFLEKYYNADCEKEIIGQSVSASEHAVMCASSAILGEENSFRRLITEVYPTGIVSIVSDTWNLWQVVTKYLPSLKDTIMARNGKLVIRPDSSRTNPQDIICGTPEESRTWTYENEAWDKAEIVGLVESLWDIFGGTTNEQGYKVLDSHIGVIYGDAITFERAEEICVRLEAKGFASTNVVFGIGSYTYQYNTRDTLGMAMKATWCKVDDSPYPIFKDPITDDGEKKSAFGLLQVHEIDGKLTLLDNQKTINGGLLKRIFHNGELIVNQSLEQVRNTLNPWKLT